MPIYYVEDYEQVAGQKPKQDVELADTLSERAPDPGPVTEAKVVEAEEKPAAKKTARARTK